ncbi:CAZyme family GT1 [Aspergillus niger]|uniref:Sterol 3-beta-glucosyltransferase n=1 Tax=Aspergillus niger TaxID=5061 RepID=A0A3F3RFY7_ASPNG|nr:CAZyme family GT1 [Aspergillus niger]KAI2927831.1 CAZyme family GT1 [Aspergillus niger]KAI2944559.1 CAZyme family GT1 [Aspergillus niger]KAI2969914.1 CAZyme family GT1 [Aspergillus niger]KAI2993062.1 CAZyme family GT1 [Aspergillus niger]
MRPFIDDAKRRVDRRLSASRQSISNSRMFASVLPERLRNDNDDDDDSQVDFSAPPGGMGPREGHMQYMHQSIFGMIAAVGSRSGFHARYDESSDSDGEDESRARKDAENLSATAGALPKRSGNESPRLSPKPQSPTPERGRRHRRTISDHKLLRPFKLNSKQNKGQEPAVQSEPQTGDEMSRASTPKRPRSVTPRAAPVLSRMVEARALLDTEDSTKGAPSTTEEIRDEGPTQKSASALSLRLKEMFGFEAPEKVLIEYACSFLQSMLLQGYMYVTEGHVCFYAYLPRKSTVAIKSGYVYKRGRKNPKYNRYWFSLKGDVLSYYADPSKLYFPSGHVDLRYGISASLAEPKDKGREVKDFQVTTDQRTYYFRADSSSSAKEWVKALQKVIFRTHNDKGSVKISFPIENIIDIEESPMVDFAETFKIRVVESEETYAIDEYYFTFFNYGQDAFNFLKGLVADTPMKRSQQTLSPQPEQTSRSRRTRGSQNRWSITSATSQSRGIGKSGNRRRSASTGQFSFGHDALSMSPPMRQQDSSLSFGNSFEQATEASGILQSMTDTTESASQILNRSDVFQSPTIRTMRRGPSGAEKTVRRHSDETARSVHTTRNGPEIQYAVSESDRDTQTPSGLHPSTPALNELVRAGVYPLQRAAGFAEYLKTRSKQMSNLLASESMGYLEKVSGMWAGGGKHYGESENILPDDQAVDPEDLEAGCKDGDRFREHFALPPSEKLQASYFAWLHRMIPLYGKIYISQKKLCFRSLMPGTRTKMILPLKDVENVDKEKGFNFGRHGLVVVIRGHEELFFEFGTADTRDDCAVTLHKGLESTKFLMASGLLAECEEKDESESATAEHRLLQEARLDITGMHSSRSAMAASNELHPIFDDPRASIINFKPTESLRITCLTIGSRGDVQPYIALCKGLLAEGHRPKIATHAEFEPWVRKHGIDFALVDGDPAELMRICVENGMFTYSFFKEATAKFRGWIDDLLSSAWKACQDTDLLIESPSAMAGIHIAEALRIPYFRAFTMPWSRTRAYPHAFAVPEHKMGGAYNYITYVMFDNVFWKSVAGQVNRWRKKELGLKATGLDKMQPNKVPFLYNYSPTVVPPPLDYPDWIRITGYWFLSEGSDWTPPAELVDFIQRARKDEKKVVYIGFGSIVVSDPSALTRTVIESVQKADVRCILSKGWSDRLGDPASAKSEVPLPPEIYQIQSAPHDWLFSHIDAAAHHGGAGTTGASLRAGVPTIVKPFFGDQFFFGTRVEDLGVGICLKKLNVTMFSRALWEATHDERMIVKAHKLGAQIRSEDGVDTAIQAIYRDLEYAKTLAQARSNVSSTPFSPTPSAKTVAEQEADEDVPEEEWTIVEDDTELEMRPTVA